MRMPSLSSRSLLVLFASIAALFILVPAVQAPAPDIVYVNPSAFSSGDGTSWEEAYSDLEEAIELSTPGVEIWCAKGEVGEIRIARPVTIYSGFSGTEEFPEERDWNENRTFIGSLTVTASAALDGFNFSFPETGGRVVFLDAVASGLRNCRFERCSSSFELISFAGCVAPSLVNCFVVGCEAGKEAASPLISFRDCREVMVVNCTIADNLLRDKKEAILRFSGSGGEVLNAILWNIGFDEIKADENSEIAVSFSDLGGGFAGEGNIDRDPLFTGDYHLRAQSPCRDRGTAEGAPEEDGDNDERPFGPGFDIGADECILEYVASTPGLAAFFTPPPLTVKGKGRFLPPGRRFQEESTPIPSPTPSSSPSPTATPTPPDYLIDEGFDNFHLGSRPSGWTFLNCDADTDTYTTDGYSGRAVPAVKLDATDDKIITRTFAEPEGLSFWLRGISVDETSSLLVEEYYASDWHPLTDLRPLPASGTTFGPFTLNFDSVQARFSYVRSVGTIAFDDVIITRVYVPTPTPSPTPSSTVTPTPTLSPSPTPSATASPTATPTPSATPSPTATATPSPSVTPTPTATASPTPTPSSTPSPSPTPTPTPIPTATTTPTPFGWEGNLLLNGGFEFWDETGEDAYYWSWDGADAQWSRTTDAYEGTYGGLLSRTISSEGSLDQLGLALNQGVTYVVSLMVKGSGEIRIGLRYPASSYVDYGDWIGLTEAEWTYLEHGGSPNAGGSNGGMRIQMKNGFEPYLIVDNASLRDNPPFPNDADGDGYSNEQEGSYGTDPEDETSHPGVVINEVYYDHPGADDGFEYVVLFNFETYPVQIGGFKIESGAAFDQRLVVPEDIVIPGGCFYLIGEDNVEDMNFNPPDLLAPYEDDVLQLQNGDQNDPDAPNYGEQSPTDGVRMVSPIASRVLDTVLWDEPNENNLPGDAHNPALSNELIPDVQPGHCLRRRILAYDTDCKYDWEEIDPHPVSSSSGTDPDNDGLSNIQEALNHTDPTKADTDSDGILDGDELDSGLNPTINESIWGSQTAAKISLPTKVTIPNTKLGSRFNFNYLFDEGGWPGIMNEDYYFGITCVRTSLYGSDHDKKQNFTVALRKDSSHVWKFPFTFDEGITYTNFSDMELEIGLTYTQVSGVARDGDGDWAKVVLKTVCPFTPTQAVDEEDNKINYGPFMYHFISVKNLRSTAITGHLLIALDGAQNVESLSIDGINYGVMSFWNAETDEPPLYDYYDLRDNTLHKNDGTSGRRVLALLHNPNIVTWEIKSDIYNDFKTNPNLNNQSTGNNIPGGISLSFTSLESDQWVTHTFYYAGYLDEQIPPSPHTYYYYYTVCPEFSSATKAVEYAVSHFSDIESKTNAFESKLSNASWLDSKTKWIIAQAFHSYLSDTFLFRDRSSVPANQPKYYFWEGCAWACNIFNTVDVGHETEVFTGYEIPWALRLNLSEWTTATFTDDNNYPNYYWLNHDLGGFVHDDLSINDKGNQGPHWKGFRLEENLDYVIMSYWYWKRSGDWSFFTEYNNEKLDLIHRFLESSIYSDADDDGIADNIDFLGGTEAKTTYDSPEASVLFSPAKNVYIGVKQMAAYIAGNAMFSAFGAYTECSFECFSQADKIRDTLKGQYNSLGHIPTSLIPSKSNIYSIVSNEGLLYLILTDTDSTMLDSELMAMLEDSYKQSYEKCRVAAGGESWIALEDELKDTSWLSKILDEDLISQQAFRYKSRSSDFVFESLTNRPRGWNDAWRYDTDSGDINVVYLSLYPRGICSWAFLTCPPRFKYDVFESGDFDGDGTSDSAIFRPSSSLWAIRNITRVYFGAIGDAPVSGDYDGDSTTDIGIFRSSTGYWSIRNLTSCNFGQEGDTPVPKDHDGDGTCDIAVFRPFEVLWAIRDVTRYNFGDSADIPVPADYDGDGCAEICIFRPSTGFWSIKNSSSFYFSQKGDAIAVGDYDGNGSEDIGIFRDKSQLWRIRNITQVYFGSVWDLAVPADHNGDGTTDMGIFRPPVGLWAIRNISRYYFGIELDIPQSR